MPISRRLLSNRQKGFTLIEVLLSLTIILIITGSLFPIYKLISQTHHMKNYNEDIYIGVKQASEYLLGSFYIDMDQGYHYRSREGEEMYLIFDRRRLVKKDGYEILIHHIDSCVFTIEDQFLYVDITRDKQTYHFLLGYAREVVEDEQ